MGRVGDLIKATLRRGGYDLHRFPIMQYVHDQGIDTILDVGANIGQYGLEMRRLGFDGRIISFEPMASAYQHLQTHANQDAKWEAVNVALGETEHTTMINVSGASSSSSLLDMLPSHTDALPASATVGTEQVEVRRLDALYGTYCPASSRVLLKIDAQGYTREILSGAEGVLHRIQGIEVELALQPLYDGEPLIDEVIASLQAAGFTLVWINQGFKNPTTQHLLNADGYFFRL